MAWTVHEDEYRNNGLDEVLRAEKAADASVSPTGKYTKSSQVFSPPSLAPAALNATGFDLKSWVNPQETTSIDRSFQGLSQKSLSPHFAQNSNFDRSPISSSFSVSPMVSKRRHHAEHTPADRYRRQEDCNADVSPIAFADWSAASKYSLSTMPNTIPPESIQGKVYETAKDQHGCRFLQRWLDTNSNIEALQMIMNEILLHSVELMTDQYANFLLQKLFDLMPNDMRFNVARVVAPKIASIAMTPHGTFSVQKMIETISSRKEIEMVRRALAADVVRLVKDAHGNHVIQKVLQRFVYSDKQFIYDAVGNECITIARNKQGCCVLQRCLEHASTHQRTTLVGHILNCCLDIVQDPFGNYVLQYVLGEKDSKINDTIAIAFLPHLVHLSMNKFSSNVMEKVLRGASIQVQEMYVEMMCNSDIIFRLIQDDFGNYVLQTALVISNPAQGEVLVAAIKPYLPFIKSAPYAKKLEGKMEAVMKRSESSNRVHREFDVLRSSPSMDDNDCGFSGYECMFASSAAQVCEYDSRIPY